MIDRYHIYINIMAGDLDASMVKLNGKSAGLLLIILFISRLWEAFMYGNLQPYHNEGY